METRRADQGAGRRRMKRPVSTGPITQVTTTMKRLALMKRSSRSLSPAALRA
jgi:hypothetical protein